MWLITDLRTSKDAPKPAEEARMLDELDAEL
jgi:hypothetical protein